MKHKTLLLLFLFSLLPSWGWGEVTEFTKTIDFKEDKYKDGYTIQQNGTYIFKGTHSGNPAQDIIGEKVKAVINVAEGLDVTIILDNVTINPSSGCPLSAKDASKVKLRLKGSNTLIAGGDCPGIWAPESPKCGIIIDEELGSSGSLIINTYLNCPGIGGRYNKSANGYITINGGIINVNAADGAGIGSGPNGSGCEITITGGTVNATSAMGAGIGSGPNGSGCEITITGGIVTATSYGSAGIGDGISSSGSTFSTGENGTAFINANSHNSYGGISDQNYKEPDAKTKGLIFDGNDGAIYGESYTLAADATIESGQTLTIKDNQTLVIKDGVTLVNKGIINNEGTITNNGTILLIGNGKIEGSVSPNLAVKGFEVTYKLNYEDSPADHIKYVENGKPLPTYNVNRKYYEFDDWYDSETDGLKVTTINQSTTVYAHWKKNEIKVVKSIPIISSSVGTNKFQAYELNNLLDESSYKEGITYNWVNDSEEHYGLDIRLNQIIGTPDKVTNDNANIKIKISGENCEDQIVDIPIKIEKGNVKFDIDEIYNCIYSGKVVDIEIPVYNHSIKEIGKASVIYYVEYNLETTPENSGAIIVGSAPKFAGEYYLYVHYNGDDNYLSSTNTTSKFIISPKELNITPLPNQKLFEGEAPAYEVIGEVNNETPEFTGSLGVESGKVVINSLALTTKFAQNYSLSLTPEVPITIINNETAKSLIQLNGTTNANGAYIDEVLLLLPMALRLP